MNNTDRAVIVCVVLISPHCHWLALPFLCLFLSLVWAGLSDVDKVTPAEEGRDDE